MTNPFDDLRAFAADLESTVPSERAHFRVAKAMELDPRRPRRTVVALATAGFMAISNVGLATVANPAVPGDALYGVDRAYERVEKIVGVTHASERLDEAAVLVSQGRASEILPLVQEALTEVLESDDPQAALAELKRKANLGEAFEGQLQALVTAARIAGQSAGEVPGEDIRKLAQQLGRDLKPVPPNRPDRDS